MRPLAVRISTAAVSTSPAWADRRIDQRRAEREDLDRLLGEEEAGHVEVMDHHVAEEPARALDILDRRRTGIARDHADDLDRAGLAGAEAAFERGEVRVEAAVEADHQRLAGFADHLEAAADAAGVEIDRLLAEHGLAGGDGGLDQVGMGIGRRADHHGVDAGIGEDRLGAGDLGAGGLGERSGRLGGGIGERDQLRIGTRRDIEPVNAPDPAGAQQSKSHHVRGPAVRECSGASVVRAENGLVEVDIRAGHQP